MSPAAHRCHPSTVFASARPGYCTACFALIDVEARSCPVCGCDLARLSEREFRNKLLVALNHPLADVRLRAIIALGWRGESENASALARCALRHPTDVVEGLQVIESVRGIGNVAAREEAWRMLAKRHPARLVRSAASWALRGHSRS